MTKLTNLIVLMININGINVNAMSMSMSIPAVVQNEPDALLDDWHVI